MGNKIIQLIVESRLRTIIIAGILICLTIWGVYFGMRISFKTAKKESVKSISDSIKIIPVRVSEISENIEIPGQIVFREKVNISSKVQGRIEKIFPSEGDVVRKGQVIALMEKLNLEITLKQQKSELDIAQRGFELASAKYSDALKSVEIKLKTIQKAKADLDDKKMTWENMKRTYENKKNLFNAGGVSKTELGNIKAQHMTLYTKYELARADYEIQQIGYRDEDIIKAGYKVTKDPKRRIEVLKKLNTKIEYAELEAARAKVRQAENSLLSTELMLKECTIRSPINGVLASRQMEAGEMVNGESVIATIIDIGAVYLSMNFNEKEISKVKKNQGVEFTVDALGDKIYKSAISRIIPLLDTKSRTIEVRALVKNPGSMLLPGMFARAKLNTGKKIKGILVPVSSVWRRNNGADEVYVIKNGIVMREKVVLGSEVKGLIEIREGLKEGDRIIISGTQKVYQGMKIDSKA